MLYVTWHSSEIIHALKLFRGKNSLKIFTILALGFLFADCNQGTEICIVRNIYHGTVKFQNVP